MNTAKDANGVEIKVGDRVRHRMLPCDFGVGGHRFVGTAEVVRFVGNAFIQCQKDGRSFYPPSNVVQV